MATGNTADIAVTVGVLAGLQFADHVVESLAKLRIYRVFSGCDHVGQRGQIMASSMPIQTAALPIAIRLGFEWQPRLAPERSKQTFWIKREDVVAIRFHGRRERPRFQQADRIQRIQVNRRVSNRRAFGSDD